MASDSFGVMGTTQPIQHTGNTGTRTPSSSEIRPNGLPPASSRTDTTPGTTTRSTNRLESNQPGRTGDSKSDPSQGVAATDTAMVEKLTEAVDKINEMMQQGKQMLTFQLDDDSGRMVVRVVDSQSKEVVRQIPSEETLNFAKYVDGLAGLIFNKKA
ncbi:flagellar protein FlaG [Allochromatium palmeri]|uniref:Flagellar biosynthesis protein FlaG n=1 Tax=Allochromatium palmeri TaxID=231048 RepID=A0A6N8E934_9GAMM|nr:flagellar protein FlaG [Allochromatium palmeri]MTW20645.1 flagellar biosynthesis protein FlaG [Allochromatium palmeri]